MAEWAGIVHATRPKYTQGAYDNTVRNYIAFAMLQKKGNVKLNESGYEIRWQIQVKEPLVTTHSDGAVIDYSASDLFRQAVLDWRGYKASDFMTMKQKEMNKSNEALIKLWDRKIPDLLKSLTRQMGFELWIDGNASGNEDRFHGLESAFGAGTVAAGDRVAQPSDTYAGLSTALAQFSSNWSTNLTGTDIPNSTIATDWPDGNGSSGYDSLSPKLVNYSSTAWGTGVTTARDNLPYAIRHAHSWTRNVAGVDGAVDVVLTSSKLYADFLDGFQAANRVLSPAKEMVDLGFNGVKLDGITIADDFTVPANRAYGINFADLTLRGLHSKLFRTEGPTYDPKSDGWTFLAATFGNFTFNPKAHFKIYAAA